MEILLAQLIQCQAAAAKSNHRFTMPGRRIKTHKARDIPLYKPLVSPKVEYWVLEIHCVIEAKEV